MEKLTLNEAVAQFHHLLKEVYEARMRNHSDGGGAPAGPLSEEDYETEKFQFAGLLIELACPDPAKCANRRCRRSGCRHLADLAARRKGLQRRYEDVRTPATHALRHAMWVYMNAQLALASTLRPARIAAPTPPES